MRSQPILPARFNTFLPTEEATIRLLQERGQEFHVTIERVKGKAELGLRILWDPPGDPVMPEGQPVATEEPGSEYLRRRTQQEQRRRAQRREGEALIRSLHGALQPLASEFRLRSFLSNRSLFAAAYLVEQERLGAFHESVEERLAESPQLGFLLTGPWPPYSFVNGVENGIANRLRL